MNEDQEDPTNHYTINMQTHYTVQYKDANCTWVGDVGKIQYYNSIAEAEEAIKKTFADVHQHHVEQATIIEWKKTPVAVKKNNKRFIESTAFCYDVEQHYDTCSNDLKPLWRPWRTNFETLEEARSYIRFLNSKSNGKYRIIKRETTSKHSVVEHYVS